MLVGSSDNLNCKSPVSNFSGGRITNASNVPSAFEISLFFWIPPSNTSDVNLVLALEVWPSIIKSVPMFKTWLSPSQFSILSTLWGYYGTILDLYYVHYSTSLISGVW